MILVRLACHLFLDECLAREVCLGALAFYLIFILIISMTDEDSKLL